MKKILLFFLCSCVFTLHALSNTLYDGIIVYTDGGEDAYLLSEMPTVTYGKNCAVINVNGKQVASVDLSGGKELIITYGEYKLSNIHETSIPKDKVQKVGKYIQGGKLIIVGKDGILYDAVGRKIN